ncbi:hypothetical protein KL911_000393 [Ogataea haglerorum]|uniref:uncharacterized protein n=1 Tax=Ogataea haglerorum TaxID=1937702 RepID=UPI001C8A4574|nr:uncharacterized protein KL911_000393 [Ogataea haglerorum]KAG7759256.1 hypothetical protein KL911_000393 [Ogataea haglerorum]
MDSSSDRGLEDDLELDNDIQHTPLSDYEAGEATKQSAVADAAKFELEAQQALKSQILILCSALGGADDSGKYVLGVDALACLKDIKRWIKVVDDASDSWNVASACDDNGLVVNDLIPILVQLPARAAESNRAFYHSILLAALELLVALTRPLVLDTERASAAKIDLYIKLKKSHPQGHRDPQLVSAPVPQRAAHRAGRHNGGAAAQRVQDAAGQRQHAARRERGGHQLLAHGVRFPRQQGAAVCADDHGGAGARVRRARARHRVSRHLLLPALRARPSHGGGAGRRRRARRCSRRAVAWLRAGARETAQEKAAEQQRDAPRQLRHAAEHSAGRRAGADGVGPETADPRGPARAARRRRVEEGGGGAADGQQEREHALGL